MKILSLDGGGSWALIQARCLLDLYGDITGNELLQQFDLVISNSGGSIVLACLIEDLPLSQICEWFLDQKTRESIFDKLHFVPPLEALAHLAHFGPRYSTKQKLIGLTAHLTKNGNKYLSDLPSIIGKPSLQIMICGFDYDHNREVFFRSNKSSFSDGSYYDRIVNHNPAGIFGEVTLVNAVHGSSNAPVNYFNKPAAFRYVGDSYDRQFWDGAIGGYNNPVFAGVLEAIANGHKVDDLRVLSIGTGSNLLPLLKDQNPQPDVNLFLYQSEISTFLYDVKKMATAIIADPPDSASFHAYTVLHSGLPANSNRFFRFSPLVKPFYNEGHGKWEIPRPFSEDEFETLVKLDMDAVKQSEVLLIDQLCHEWINLNGDIDNQPIRYNSMLKPIIGYGKYQQAKAAFLAHF